MPKRQERASRRQFGMGVVLGFAVVGLAFFGITRAPQIVARVPSLAAVISSVLVELTNNDRSSTGLATLTVNPTLTEIAQAKANDMAAKGYFAHTSPEGLTPWYWFKQGGYKFSYAGENLAIDFSESPDVERAWMNSPTHRANVLGTQFSEIGVAVATGMYQGRATTFVVQEFGTPITPAIEAPVVVAPIATTTPKGKTPVKVATTTPPAPSVRPLLGDVTPTLPALATTIPTTTVAATPSTVLGESAGAYLPVSTSVPWWFKVISYWGLI
jgi:uncharacterized protein YkwD